MNKKKFYDYQKLDSFNAVYNFLVGPRGNGKTYGAKKKALNNWFRKGQMFIYARRYKTEISRAKETFFADISQEFPEWEFRVNGNTAEVTEFVNPDDYANEGDYNKALKDRKWDKIGYFVALSTAQTLKSVSYPKVTTIIFDEFIIERGNLHYLPEEHIVFNNFFSTVDRYQDKTRVYFLANAVSIMNPYFIEYEIRPDNGDEFIKKADGFVVAHFTEANNFQEHIKKTRFGRFIADTDYAKYAVQNDFTDNNDSLIGLKGEKASYMFTLETSNGQFSVWKELIGHNFYVQRKQPSKPVIFTLEAGKMSEGKVLMSYSDKPLQYLRAAFRNAYVYFDEPKTRNTFAEIFKR